MDHVDARPAPVGLHRLRVQVLRGIAWTLSATNLGLLALFAVSSSLDGRDLLILFAASALHAIAALTVGRRWQPQGPVGVIYLAAITVLVLLALVTADAPDTEGFWFLLIPGGIAGIAFSRVGVAATVGLLVTGYLATVSIGGGHTWALTSVRSLGLAVLAWAVWSLTSRLGAALSASELQAEQLRHANDRLRELDALKDDFVSTVSHELRTPLTVILGLSATLNARWSALATDQRVLLSERIEANARSLDSIIATLLDVARIERGALDQRTERVVLGDVVEDVVARLDLLLRDHDVTVAVTSRAAVAGDRRLLERVIENLLTNAARHTPPGTGVRAEVSTVLGQVVVTVVDAGPGIPPDALQRLGERFYRGGPTEGRHSAGVGLGLAFVSEVLDAHGVTLEVTSEPGRGARFGFRLPVLVDGADEVAPGPALGATA